jgi:hypothetical protein
MRGTTVRFRGVTPTISLKQPIHVGGLNIFIQSSDGKNVVKNGNSGN